MRPAGRRGPSRSAHTSAGVRLWGAVWVVVALVLTACSSLAEDQTIRPGLGVGRDQVERDLQVAPAGPRAGADPMEIVRDFVQALAGSGGDYVTAREYLTGEAERDWSPETRTLIFRGSVQVTDPNGSPGTPRAADAESAQGATVVEAEAAEPAPTATAEPTAESTLPPVEDGDTVLRLRASAWAEVGRLGHYRELPGPQDVTSEVILRRDDGEWRIRHLDPGFGRWLATADFERLFDPYAVHYVSTGERVLVPDIRYVPTDRVATRLAQLQLDETPDYLLGAVRHDI